MATVADATRPAGPVPLEGPARRRGLLDAVAARCDTDAAAVATLLLLVALAFSPWWLGGRIIAPLDTLHEAFAPWRTGGEEPAIRNHFTSDAITQYIVYRHIAARSFALDGRVGWNELTAGGRPEYANTMALYGDWTMQLHRWLEFWTAWHIGLMLQLITAGLGMYVLLRSRRTMPLVALVAAVAFAAGTPLVFSLYHRWLLASFSWVPWLFWAALRWRGGARSAWALVPVFLALALLGASLQTAVLLVVALAALWGAWVWEARTATRPSGERLRATGHVAAWGLLGAGLAAFWLLPSTLAYLDAMDLHGARSAPGYEHGLLQPLLGLVFIPLQAVPTLLGSPASLDLTKLFHADLAYVAFFGLVPTLAALRCITWRGTDAAARLLILAGLAIPLTPLVGTLYHRAQVLFLFGGVWAFALYWQNAEPHGHRTLRALIAASGAVAVVWLAVSLLLWGLEARLAAVLQASVAGVLDAGGGGRLGGFREWMLQRAAHLLRELRIWHPVQLVAAAGAALGLRALWLRGRGRADAAALVLLAALVLELGSLAVRWHTAVDPARHPPYPLTPELARLQEVTAGGRVHIAAPYDGAAPFFPPNTLAMYDVAAIDQFETVDIHGMWQAAGRAADAGTLGGLGVTHAVAPGGTPVEPGWRLLAAGNSFDIWENNAALPRYLAVGPASPIEASLAAARQAGSDAAAAGQVAGGEASAHGGAWSAEAQPVPPAIRVVAATPNRRRLQVAAGTEFIRVAENWSEGWQYRTGDGEWRPAARQEDGSMLLRLPDAREPAAVEMEYRPARRRAGWRLTAAAALLTLAGAAGGLSRRTMQHMRVGPGAARRERAEP